MTQNKGLINAFWLKMIMAVLMLMDHLYYFLPPWPRWFHQAARLVAPVFAFLVAEGMFHTRNRKAYIGRMFLFGGMMLAGNFVLMYLFGGSLTNSILISLALSATVIYCLDQKEHVLLYRILAVLAFAACFFFEGQFLCPVMVLIFYYLRERRLIMCWVYILAMPALLYLMGFSLRNDQYLMILAIVPILLYNGKRGNNGAFAKYFFYFFYPLHIWILFLMMRGVIPTFW